MNPPFTLVVVHGDGTHVLRLRVPRWLAYGGLAVAGLTLAVAFGASDRYLRLAQQSGRLAALQQRVDDQGELIESFRTRVASVRTEIGTWEALHARMWDALGPAGGSDPTATGIGGPTPAAEAPVADVDPLQELNLLANGIAEESPRLHDLERMINRTGRIMNALPLRWPVHGPVRSEFGRRPSPWTGKAEQHPGIDIGMLPGTPVMSPAAGTVVAAGYGGGYGRHVMLDHGHGVRSVYGHLMKIDVKTGQRVEKGQIVGLTGSTGRSTGPHLHYEVRVEGKPVNPRDFLWDQAVSAAAPASVPASRAAHAGGRRRGRARAGV